MKHETMGNQQVRLYSWLGGIVDGEGSFYCTLTKCSCLKYPKYKEDKIHIRVALKIEMACLPTIKRCEGLFRNMGVNIKMRQRTKRIKNDTEIGYYHSVTIANQKQLLKVIPCLIPYLFTKQKQAKLVLRYIHSRKYNNSFEYSKRELKLAEKMRVMNKVTSETIR